jgi:hypothetical protein
MIKTTLLLFGLTASMAHGQTMDIFPIRSVSNDRTQIAVELDNESNYDIFCEYIVSPVIYRSSESINNIDDPPVSGKMSLNQD